MKPSHYEIERYKDSLWDDISMLSLKDTIIYLKDLIPEQTIYDQLAELAYRYDLPTTVADDPGVATEAMINDSSLPPEEYLFIQEDLGEWAMEYAAEAMIDSDPDCGEGLE